MAVKNMSVPVAVFVAIVGCVLAVSANVTTSKIHQNLEQERQKRLAAEQELQKAQGSVGQLRGQLGEAQQKLKVIDDVINQGKSTTTNLKNQLDALASEKAALANQVKELQKALTDVQQAAVSQQPVNQVPPPSAR